MLNEQQVNTVLLSPVACRCKPAGCLVSGEECDCGYECVADLSNSPAECVARGCTSSGCSGSNQYCDFSDCSYPVCEDSCSSSCCYRPSFDYDDYEIDSSSYDSVGSSEDCCYSCSKTVSAGHPFFPTITLCLLRWQGAATCMDVFTIICTSLTLLNYFVFLARIAEEGEHQHSIFML